MQNYYGIERMIQDHQRYAHALAARQALARQAAHRPSRVKVLWAWLAQRFRHSGATEPERRVLVADPVHKS